MDGSDLSLPICSILVSPVPDGSWSCLLIDARVSVITSNLLEFATLKKIPWHAEPTRMDVRSTLDPSILLSLMRAQCQFRRSPQLRLLASQESYTPRLVFNRLSTARRQVQSPPDTRGKPESRRRALSPEGRVPRCGSRCLRSRWSSTTVCSHRARNSGQHPRQYRAYLDSGFGNFPLVKSSRKW